MIAGLDPSLNGTGLATENYRGIVDPGKLRDTARLRFVRNRVGFYLAQESVRLVVIEGYSFKSKNRAHHMGEMGGVLRVMIVEAGMQYMEMPPASVKIFATNNGNCEKDEMLLAAQLHLGYEGEEHDVADAMWMREAGLYIYGGGTYQPPSQRQVEAIQALSWPALAQR